MIQFKTFSQHTIISNFHRNKYNVQLPFLNTFAPVSLYYNIPLSKNNGLASALQYPFRTGSKHPKKWVVPHTGLGTRAGNVTKKRSFEEIRGFANLESAHRMAVSHKPNLVLAACGGYPCCCRNKHAAARHFLGRRGAALYRESTLRVLSRFFLQKQKERKNVSLSEHFTYF